MVKEKIVFIDRDGTIIVEPEDKQIDSLEKLELIPEVIPALLQLQQAGFTLVMISNQDGLGTKSFPKPDYEKPQQKLMQILNSQGITFSDILICPHLPADNCDCRKPKLGLVLDYLRQGGLNLQHSYVIGDRETDMQLAENMGIKGILFESNKSSWLSIADLLTKQPRVALIQRETKETKIDGQINLDATKPIAIDSGIGFFDHMLEQLAKHGGFSLELKVNGDLHIDQHHTIEDTALAIGAAFKQALGDKRGIGRYGFVLPMDEAQAQVAIDLSARPNLQFDVNFTAPTIGEVSTEMFKHFFISLTDALGAAIHIQVIGENNHHMVESIFKAVGRSLNIAIKREHTELPSTKGVL